MASRYYKKEGKLPAEVERTPITSLMAPLPMSDIIIIFDRGWLIGAGIFILHDLSKKIWKRKKKKSLLFLLKNSVKKFPHLSWAGRIQKIDFKTRRELTDCNKSGRIAQRKHSHFSSGSPGFYSSHIDILTKSSGFLNCLVSVKELKSNLHLVLVKGFCLLDRARCLIQKNRTESI